MRVDLILYCCTSMKYFPIEISTNINNKFLGKYTTLFIQHVYIYARVINHTRTGKG